MNQSKIGQLPRGVHVEDPTPVTAGVALTVKREQNPTLVSLSRVVRHRHEGARVRLLSRVCRESCFSPTASSLWGRATTCEGGVGSRSRAQGVRQRRSAAPCRMAGTRGAVRTVLFLLAASCNHKTLDAFVPATTRFPAGLSPARRACGVARGGATGGVVGLLGAEKGLGEAGSEKRFLGSRRLGRLREALKVGLGFRV